MGDGRQRRRRRRRLRGAVAVLLIDGVVELQGRQGVRQAQIRLRRVEPEAQLDARLQLVEVVVRDAPAPGAADLAAPFAAEPRLLAEHVRRPRSLLVQG